MKCNGAGGRDGFEINAYRAGPLMRTFCLRCVMNLDCSAQSATIYPGGNSMPIELPLNTMSVGEKVQLLEQVWDNLCRQSGDVRSPEWHAEILNERKRQIENGTMTVSPWSEAKERLQSLENDNRDLVWCGSGCR
jgi:hypothetical protein